jgi:hypothetical protein
MATIQQFNSYQVYIASHPQFNEWQANIKLRLESTLVVDIRFVGDPANWANRGAVNPGGISTIYVGSERFPWFVDILRNEKPLYAVLYPPTHTAPPLMLLQTGTEPVGEAEGR